MIESGDSLVVGVSGGADSVCLLRILYDLSGPMRFSLAAVHVEHGIRGEESRRDAVFTEELCADLGVPFLRFDVDAPAYARGSGLGLEEAARELRYDCYRKACEQLGADRIATAHHAGDNAETVLFHLARGTGIGGLCGIRPVAESDSAGLRVIRPLLCVTHEEIVSWLKGLGQLYCIDSTNADPVYSRNRIRERVLPELMEINAQAIPHMQRTAGQLQELCEYLDGAALQAGKEACEISAGEDGSRSIELFCDAFGTIHPFLQKHLVHLLLGMQAGCGKDLTSLHVEMVLDLMNAGVGRRVSLPYGMTAERMYKSVLLHAESGGAFPGEASCGSPEEQDLRIPGETTGPDGLQIQTKILEVADFSQKIPEKRYTKWFDYDKIKSVARIRGRRPGDYLQVGAAGGHKKLNRYLIDEKIPLRERDGLSLLADGNHIMWVIGYRISEAYKVTDETRRVLCVTVAGRE